MYRKNVCHINKLSRISAQFKVNETSKNIFRRFSFSRRSIMITVYRHSTASSQRFHKLSRISHIFPNFSWRRFKFFCNELLKKNLRCFGWVFEKVYRLLNSFRNLQPLTWKYTWFFKNKQNFLAFPPGKHDVNVVFFSSSFFHFLHAMKAKANRWFVWDHWPNFQTENVCFFKYPWRLKNKFSHTELVLLAVICDTQIWWVK